MGTRCITVLNDEKGKEIAVLYRQFDGYPEGHGIDLKTFLEGLTITNGISGDSTRIANGMGCLAAQVIAHFKTEVGNFYLYPAGTRDCGEEYIYTVSLSDGKLSLQVQEGSMSFFGAAGTPQDEMSSLYDGPIAEFEPE